MTSDLYFIQTQVVGATGAMNILLFFIVNNKYNLIIFFVEPIIFNVY